MPHPGKSLSPHGVERRLLGVGATGARFYFRLGLSKFSRLTRRCLSVSAACLGLCVWLSLITVMSVAPIEPDGRIARGAAAATLKEDANFFTRSGEPSDNEGSYPHRPRVSTGYLSTIDMQHEKGEKYSKGADEAGETKISNRERRRKSNKQGRKAFASFRSSPTVERTADNVHFGSSNTNNILKSTGVGRRRIHGYKTDETKEIETSSPSSSKRRKWWKLIGPRSEINRGSNTATSPESSQTFHSSSPSPTISSLPNQAPSPPLRSQRWEDGRRNVINIGPSPISGIKSSRQATGRIRGNQLPNLPSGKEMTGDKVVLKVDSEIQDGTPEGESANQVRNIFLSAQSHSEMVAFKTLSHHKNNGPLSGQQYLTIPPTKSDKENSEIAPHFSGLREQLTNRGFELLKKSINKIWPSDITVGRQNRQGDFYDGHREALGINSRSVNVHDSSSGPEAQRIETSAPSSIGHSYTRRQGMEKQTDNLLDLPNEQSRRTLLDMTVIKPENHATVQKSQSSERKKLSPNNPDPFQSVTYRRKKEDTRLSKNERHEFVTVAISEKPGARNFDHSITRGRQGYNSELGIRDGLDPHGPKQTVESFRSSSRQASNLTPDTQKSQADFSDSYQTRDQPGKTRDPIYSAEGFDKMDGMNGTPRNLSSLGVQSKTFTEKASKLSRSSKEDSRSDERNKKRSWDISGVIQNDGFDIYSYNVTASDAISLTRSIPDTRPAG
ncbi:hypothetical protein EGW08_020124 [Elysia chlorotica]|uniref:Uncharacterized protein n=1 Tax=Elysia chlorotica TaxID=188477 RepID=A0A3S1B0U3_ELYCH|nr:hypothetical protein EGW08_020124 [Elysia chlorotica]